MPQNDPVITYKIGDSTIILQPGYVPDGFDSMPAQVQNNIRNILDSVAKARTTQQQKEASIEFARFCWSALFGAMLLIVIILAKTNYFNRVKGLLQKEFIWIFIGSFILLIPSIYNNIWPLTVFLFLAILISLKMLIQKAGRLPEDNDVVTYDDNPPSKKLRYEGSQLNFSIPTIHTTLEKHWPYFSMLDPFDKDKFGERVKQFIAIRTYDIYDDSGFMEMPILISAAAIQITFGLNDYLLEDFPLINIYPDAFFSANPFPRFLEGNVSNSCINLSWKYFLQGINCYTDGDNVGLHEMAHALYSHEFIQKQHADNFCKTYEEFNDYGEKIFSNGKTADNNLYGDYAFKNIQEFWAVSIEIFFERPAEMKTKFPTLYNAITDILNQDPANKITVLKSS